jgi:hypothetical protein
MVMQKRPPMAVYKSELRQARRKLRMQLAVGALGVVLGMLYAIATTIVHQHRAAQGVLEAVVAQSPLAKAIDEAIKPPAD